MIEKIGSSTSVFGSVKPQSKSTVDFKDQLMTAIKEIDGLQKETDLLTNKLVLGEIDDVSKVTIAQEKAALSMQLAMSVRNKVIDAYQEVMRMQV